MSFLRDFNAILLRCNFEEGLPSPPARTNIDNLPSRRTCPVLLRAQISIICPRGGLAQSSCARKNPVTFCIVRCSPVLLFCCYSAVVMLFFCCSALGLARCTLHVASCTLHCCSAVLFLFYYCRATAGYLPDTPTPDPWVD